MKLILILFSHQRQPHRPTGDQKLEPDPHIIFKLKAKINSINIWKSTLLKNLTKKSSAANFLTNNFKKSNDTNSTQGSWTHVKRSLSMGGGRKYFHVDYLAKCKIRRSQQLDTFEERIPNPPTTRGFNQRHV